MTIHWADVAASELADKGPHTLATGITPSGPVHIGNMREVMTADKLYGAVAHKRATVLGAGLDTFSYRTHTSGFERIGDIEPEEMNARYFRGRGGKLGVGNLANVMNARV